MRRRGRSGSTTRAWLIDFERQAFESYSAVMDDKTRAACLDRMARLESGEEVRGWPGWLLTDVVPGVEHDATYVLTARDEMVIESSPSA